MTASLLGRCAEHENGKDCPVHGAVQSTATPAARELLIGALLRILALSEAGDERGHIANEALQGRVA